MSDSIIKDPLNIGLGFVLKKKPKTSSEIYQWSAAFMGVVKQAVNKSSGRSGC